MPDPTLLERARALPGVEAVAGLPGVFLAGGAVRDLLRGETAPKDIDLVVEGALDPVLARLGEPTARHDRFGTATVERDGGRVDLTMARAESYPRPGALPEVRPAGIEEDLGRRDFTVNALALDLGTGRLLAPDDAERDLAAGRLRVLHPGSFGDDPTRLIRLARYAGRLGFGVEDATRALAEAAVRHGALRTVTDQRVATELRLLAREPLESWAVLRELGIDEGIAPGFGIRDRPLAERALALLPTGGGREALLLSLARGEEGPDIAGRSPGEVAELLRTPEQAAVAGARGAADEARRWLDETRHVALEITGDDLLAAGVPPGPELGAVLRSVLRAKRDGEVGGRAEELALAHSLLDR